MINIISAILLFSSFTLFSKDLEFQKIFFNRDDTEISGLHFKDGNLLFVADKLSNRAIYKAVFEDDRFYYKSYINLSDLTGHNKYFKDVLLNKNRSHILLSPFDLEGISSCKNDYFIVNEQAREILKINKTFNKLDIDFKEIFKNFGHPLEKISVNAGFEGVAADCARQILYISQERGPRAIIEVDLKTLKTVNIFQTEVTDKKQKNLDYADLHFENDFLYILERNSYQILKYSLKNKKVISSYSFINMTNFKANELYNTGEPYGLAEGLTMNSDVIYIAFDNNKSPLSTSASKKFKISGNVSSILTFKRPKDF